MTIEWISVEKELPDDGIYNVKAIRDGEEIELQKKLITSGDQRVWFGGIRPFSSNDIVTHWRKDR